MADLPPIEPDLVAELAAIAETLAARDDHADLAARLEWLIDTLILRGQLPASFRRLAAKVRGERSVVRLAMFRDKHAVPSSDVDCAARIPLCGARCCSFEVTLSTQDVADGLPFDVVHPYAMAKQASGTCACAGEQGACTVYDKRPGACRAYDCRNDKRVWIDFEARIIQPLRHE